MRPITSAICLALASALAACDTPSSLPAELANAQHTVHAPASPRASMEPALATNAWLVSGGLDLDGQPVSFGVSGAQIVPAPHSPARTADLHGYYLVPAFIDSHVHLAYYPVADALPAGGIVAAVDFAAPLAAFADTLAIPVLRSGPMITSPAGYPTQSWGAGGYGLEVASASAAEAAVDQLLAAGASFVKAPLDGSQGVDDAELAALVARAHARGVKVAVHALSAADAARAIASQVDILGHTPLDALSQEQLTAWGTRTVVSTLAAFGSSPAAIANLQGFANAGARILYGTDLGNTREVGIQSAELAALAQAGLSGRAIVRAGTRDAADFWGFSELGELSPGKRASFLVLSQNPADNPQTLVSPRAVVFDGRVVAGSLP